MDGGGKYSAAILLLIVAAGIYLPRAKVVGAKLTEIKRVKQAKLIEHDHAYQSAT